MKKREKREQHITKGNVHCYKLFVVEKLLNDERKDHTQYCNNRRHEGNPESNLIDDSLAAKPSVTSFVEVNPTFFGYIHAVFILLKHAVGKQSSNSFIAIR